jgi:type IV pilus assembly protein PilB
MASNHRRLGDILLEQGILAPEAIERAIEEQRRTGELLGAVLVRLGLVSEDTLLESLRHQLGLPVVDLAEVIPEDEALVLVKEDLAKKYLALPLTIVGRSTLQVAMSDPLNVAAIEDLRFHSGMFIQPLLARPSSISEAIERYYHIDSSMDEVISTIIQEEEDVVVNAVRESAEAEPLEELIRESEGRPIVRLTNWLMHRAVEERASDIHIEPQERDLAIRLRIDGLLHEIQRLPKWTQGAIVSRVKVLANLDIAERRHPQDGRLMVEVRDRRVDMRVSTLPTTHGEKVVIRIADQQHAPLDLAQVGLLPDDLARIRRYAERPQGIVLVTGPTGSGKTSLLYACIRHAQDETKNIMTVEDPVEYQLPGINQVQVDERAKKTFPAALRALLRQDPDVIMIGEVRDQETAQIAFRASITGHLVLTTVHTNDAASAVTRIVDLGLEPFMVASSLVGVISMRLVRTLCPRCKEPYQVDAASLNRLGMHHLNGPGLTLFRGVGCSHCHNTGYHGRTGIFEILEVTDVIRQLIVAGASDSAIRITATEGGMRSIGEDGLQRVLSGQTTLEEVARVVYLEEQTLRMCPSCQHILVQEFDYCPSCGDYVGEHCEKCRRRLSARWRFCGFCGAANKRYAPSLTAGELPPQPGPAGREATGADASAPPAAQDHPARSPRAAS